VFDCRAEFMVFWCVTVAEYGVVYWVDEVGFVAGGVCHSVSLEGQGLGWVSHLSSERINFELCNRSVFFRSLSCSTTGMYINFLQKYTVLSLILDQFKT